MVWTPHVTVAAVIENDGRFLIVEELIGEKLVFNQPAGHLEAGESLIEAVKREVLEETDYHITPTAIIGIYRWINPQNSTTYLRIAFTGFCTGHDYSRPLDPEIQHVHWLTLHDLELRQNQLRSPLVLACIKDYLNGHRHPLTLMADL